MRHFRLLLISVVSLLAASPRTIAQDGGPPRPDQGRLLFDPKSRDWIELPPPEPGTEAGDLELARRQLAERKFDAARKAIKAWLQAHPDSALRPEGLYTAADVELYAANSGASNDLWKAHERYDEILNGWAGSEVAERAMRRELLVAEMFLFKGHKRKIFGGMFRVSAEEEALGILERLASERTPGSRIAEQAIRMQADYHFSKGDHVEAERAYARLAREFPRGRFHRLAMLKSADSALASHTGVEFDDAPLLESEERYHEFIEQYPKAGEEANVPAQLETIRIRRAEKEYSVAQYYERAKHPEAANFYYRSVVKNWPDTVWATKARDRLDKLQPPATEPPSQAPVPPANAPVSAPPRETPQPDNSLKPME